ncbi:MAG TPA: NnrS family protein [Burkholderiaceae bacterium]|nr:NnrS family protein [Burkholderiaceae bacterium]
MLDVWRPLWLLAALNAIVIAHGLLPIAQLALPGTLVAALRLAVDPAGGALLLFVAWRWGVVQSRRNRLAMRQLVADGLTWLVFWLLQVAVLVRVAAEAVAAWATPLTFIAISVWCVALAWWAARLAPIYLQPRVQPRADGRARIGRGSDLAYTPAPVCDLARQVTRRRDKKRLHSYFVHG